MNHYDWLDRHFGNFLKSIGIENPDEYIGLINAHGDKCYGQEFACDELNILFEHYAAIYLVTYLQPFSRLVRDTENGFVAPHKWIFENYENFECYLKEK